MVVNSSADLGVEFTVPRSPEQHAVSFVITH
jgi:hypothetical protein